MTEPIPTDPNPPDGEPTEFTGPPRWVKVLGGIALALLLLLAALMLTGGPGEHGPGRHSLGAAFPAQLHLSAAQSR